MNPETISLLPFDTIRRMCEIKREDEERASSGTSGWDADAVPEPDDPDGPADRELFVNYMMAVTGAFSGSEDVQSEARARADAEYERQLKCGGYGTVRDRNGREF